MAKAKSNSSASTDPTRDEPDTREAWAAVSRARDNLHALNAANLKMADDEAFWLIAQPMIAAIDRDLCRAEIALGERDVRKAVEVRP